MSQKDLFEIVFGSNENDSEPLFDEKEKILGRFIYDVACEYFQPDKNNSDDDGNNDNADAASMASFGEKNEVTKENFDLLFEFFKKTRKAKNAFRKNFEKSAPQCMSQIKVLREIAEAISETMKHSDKFNIGIAKFVGAVAATIGGMVVSLWHGSPLAAKTVPLTMEGADACVSGGVAFDTDVTQIVHFKTKLAEVRRVIKQQEKSYSLMANWFIIPKEMKKALDSLVDYSVLKEVGEDLKKIYVDVERASQMTVGDFKIRFKEVLKLCMGKMNQSGKITSEFGDIFTPIVMVFIFFFCLLKGRNRIMLDCIMINQSLALSLNAILNVGVPACQVANGLARGAAEFGDDFFKLFFIRIFVSINIAIDLFSQMLNSIEKHKRLEPEQAKTIKDVSEKLEQMFRAIENAYNATEKCAIEAPKKWSVIVVNAIPDDAREEDIKMAVKSHLSDKAGDCIKLKRLPTNGNNWVVKVPESDSEQLLQQSDLIIKEQLCVLTK